VTRHALRRQIDAIAAAVDERTPQPEPWDYLTDPRHRAYGIVVGLAVPLLEAELVVEADPRREAIEAAAAQREPLLAAVMCDLSDAVIALERGEPVELPTPSPKRSPVLARTWTSRTR
jgi:hypothetical protein